MGQSGDHEDGDGGRFGHNAVSVALHLVRAVHDPEENAPMQMPPEARRRIARDHVVWLTTVTDSGAPAPNPVWFVPVSLHFNSADEGGDVVVITGEATATPGRRLSDLRPYLDKYEASISGPLATTVEKVAETYDTEIRVRPTRVRLTS